MKFNGGFLKQDKVTFNSKATLNFYIVYEINLWPLNLDSKFTLLDFLFETVKLTENVDPDMFILDMVLEFIHMELFHCQMVLG